MNTAISAAIQQMASRVALVGHGARTAWTLASAVIAVVAGISTLNMAVADIGMATLNEIASPWVQQIARLTRQA
ncbi:MAG TPA: hypothetical protein VN577_05645 [Terriglobales bacterium]|nr:hypothetical protein [Terriglobales bacterium]